MSKRIGIPGLGAFLKKAGPVLKQITNGQAQLSEGVTLDIPDDFQPFTITDEGSSTRIDFAPMTIHIDNSQIPWLAQLLGIHGGPEKMTYLSVGPQSVDTKVGMFPITMVDG